MSSRHGNADPIRCHTDGWEATPIDAAELPRIFDRFYRGTLANEARGSGSGLGLAIVRSIVDMHHGIELVRHTSLKVVALPLGIGPVNHADCAFQPGRAQSFGGVRSTVQA